MEEKEKTIENLYLTTEEVAHLFRVTPRTIHNYRKENKLPFIQISRKNIQYKLSDVLNLMRSSNSSTYLKDKLEKYAYSFIQLK